MTFIQIYNENAQKMTCSREGEIQLAARDLKPALINLIIVSRACQNETNIRENLIHINVIYLWRYTVCTMSHHTSLWSVKRSRYFEYITHLVYFREEMHP